jgi:glycosyltransferase involved in cell wall biosynthesis
VPFFPPAYAFGGPVEVAYQIARELVKRKHEVVVYTSDAKDVGSRLSINSVKVVDEIKVHYFRNLSLIPVKKSKLFVTPHIVSRAKEELESFDVVHLNELRTFQNIVIAHYAKKHGVPYVLQAHGSLPRIIAKKRLKSIYDVLFGYRLLRDASKVIALSRMEAEQYRSMGVPEEKIAVVPNGIDLSEYADLPPKGRFKKKFNIDEDEKIVLYLGRIHRIKGIDILVKAFANIVEKLDDVKLVVVGPDDGYLWKLEALTKALKIENHVLILGPLYGKDKLEAYVDAEVYVLPSRYEIWGMTVLEAVACGTPIILTENCGIAEHYRDKVGLVVKLNSKSLGEVLLKMLLNQDKQAIFRESCKTVIEKFNISKTVSDLEKIYEEIVK